MEKTIEKVVVRKEDLPFLKEARRHGFSCCVVAYNGMVVTVGVQSLLETCSLKERVFFIDDVLRCGAVPCAL